MLLDVSLGDLRYCSTETQLVAGGGAVPRMFYCVAL